MKSSLLTLNGQPAIPKTRLDSWLISGIAVLMIGLGYALVLAPEPTLRFLASSRTEPGPFPDVMLATASFLGGLLGILGLPLLFLAPIADREIRKRIALGLYLTTMLFIFLPRHDPLADWLIVIKFALMMAATTLIGPFFSGSPRRPYEDMQVQWREQIREAAAQQERNRLARDLHDSIKQQLFSIRVGSAAVEARWDQDPQGAREALSHVRKSAHEAVVEMQAMLLQLRPEALATVGLVEALREQCESLGYRTGATVDLEVGNLPADNRWPAGSQEALFRVAQEAMANVARHARAAKVLVRLDRCGLEGEAIVLEVQDDGEGFERSGPSSGMGMRNMTERLQPFGGSLEVKSVLHQGTNLTARLPMDQSASKIRALPKAASFPNRWMQMEQTGILVALLGIVFGLAPNINATFSKLLCVVLVICGLAASLVTRWSRQEPHRVQTYALYRLLTYGVALWANPLITSGSASLLLWAAALLSLSFGLLEGIDFVRRQRRAGSSADPKGQNALFAVLLASLLGAPLVLFVPAISGVVARMGLLASSLLFIAWWLRDKLTEEPKS